MTTRRGNCKKASVGLQCEIGLRCRTYFVLCGSVLSVWTKVENVLSSVSGTNVKMQIVRLRTEDGQRIVGTFSTCFSVTPTMGLSLIQKYLQRIQRCVCVIKFRVGFGNCCRTKLAIQVRLWTLGWNQEVTLTGRSQHPSRCRITSLYHCSHHFGTRV